MSKRMLISLALCCSLAAVQVNADDVLHYQNSFVKNDNPNWVGWAAEHRQTVESVPNAYEGKPGLKLTTGHNDWNTMVVKFPKPIRVTANTVVRFFVKCRSIEGLNIANGTNGGQYFIKLKAPQAGTWFEVQQYLGPSVYKSGGKANLSMNDLRGMEGSNLSSIQISAMGSEVWISDFRVFEAEKPVQPLPPRAPLQEGPYIPRKFPELESFFPYGVIYQGVSDVINGQMFGHDPRVRYELSLRDVKRHYMNTYSNFVDGTPHAFRWDLNRKLNLRILETMFANADIEKTPQAPAIVKEAIQQGSILAWYGKDEPSEYKSWFDSKQALGKLDPKRPFTSAFSNMDAVRTLGPYCEVSIIDPYTTLKDSYSVNNLIWHSNYIRLAREYTAGKKVWFIAQGFSERRGLRYNTPAEMRFEAFNALSAGVDGLFFFIYNDTSTYLQPFKQREKFDETLVDPWFNGNASFDALARIGRDVVPLLPSLTGRAELPDTGFAYDKEKLVLQAFRSNAGQYAVIVNKSLEKPYRGEVVLPVGRGRQLYDLIKLSPIKDRSKAKLELAPGDGAMLLMATPAEWDAISTAVRSRKAQAELDLLTLDAQELKTAGFATTNLEAVVAKGKDILVRSRHGNDVETSLRSAWKAKQTLENSNPAYLQQQKALQEIRENFGRAHMAIQPKIGKIDGSQDPAWLSLFERMRTKSRQYFALYERHRAGDFRGSQDIVSLATEVALLEADIKAQVAKTV